ncbi:HAMP domain-containing methyl-accepting chemotaxis protein [Alloacidobacterium sp.]|uniref:methyl-accepting chemotaxis protein n=1 Tax=Alloacidobacterium sp. TaxID=2951999 RepID=UPI002D459A1F|nr:HAMP domain-containing methyl-accepting chemotaxis protein [Alloacidobacterium sp.]HYK35995.1 HAMP domain-containing methyl-accepting chemotaxis protein [Alloacidobacterium sp.]
MSFTQSRLTNKLRLSTVVLVLSILLGSFAAYLKMREASQLSESVAADQIPVLSAVRDLRVALLDSSNALKAYMLFGVDPTMAARYHDMLEKSRDDSNLAISQIQNKRQVIDNMAGAAQVEAMLNEYHAFEQGQQRVEAMAIGQGSDATSKAYDLLQGEVADHEAACRKAEAAVVGAVMQAANSSLLETVRSMRLQAIYLWLAIVFGGVVGSVLAELSIRRVVRSVVFVADRAQHIAEGDLMGESLHIDSNDEVGGLATSINRMQDNLREMIRTMMEIANTVNGDSAKLANSSAESFRRTKEQSLQTQQAASAMQEMSISIAEVSRHAQNAAENAKEASKTAKQGGATVEQMLMSMQTIADSVRNTATTVQRLGKESEQIIRIVNVIEEIAQKTNLLALNAAIEAARAGEQGRGFAVVAGEVRRLAESTRNATSEIAQMIEGIRAHTLSAVEAMESGTATVNEGVETTTRAGEALQRIIHMADQVDGMIAQIAAAAMQQSEAARQSSANVDIINRLGEENAAAIPESNAIVNSVQTGARRLQEHIANFRLEETRASVPKSYSPQGLSVQPAHAYGD